VTLTRESAPSSRRRAVRDILLYGVAGGLLIAVLKLTEYRFLVVEHSVEIYGALVAALFAGLGIWLGQTLTRKKHGELLHKSTGNRVAVVYEDSNGWHTEILDDRIEQISPSFNALMENAKEVLSHYVNRRGDRVPSQLKRGANCHCG